MTTFRWRHAFQPATSSSFSQPCTVDPKYFKSYRGSLVAPGFAFSRASNLAWSYS